MSGMFRKQQIPEEILNELILSYQTDQVTHQKLKNLDRIVQQLELNRYSSNLKANLEIICKKHCMITALLNLKNDQMQILETMFDLMQKMGKKEQKSVSGQQPKANIDLMGFQKSDIYMLKIMESKRKYDCERSHCYLGYKLLWIMQTFLEGRQFPYGSLSQERWECYVFHIASLVTQSDFIVEFLKFDPVCFFDVIVKLFKGEPYCFIIDELKRERKRVKLRPEGILECINHPVE